MSKYVKGRICEEPECTRVIRSHGLCRVHHDQKKKDGTLRPSAVAVYHGMGKSSEYSSWRAMKAKCHRKTDRHYPKFGGRGIKVCDAWRESFDAFYRDMGKKPDFPGYKGSSIHRIDPSSEFNENL